MQVSQSVVKDFPDLQLPSGLEVIAGLLCVPLSRGGKDFIAFLRKGQLRDVHWAGRPYRDTTTESVLEPRKSFKVRSNELPRDILLMVTALLMLRRGLKL